MDVMRTKTFNNRKIRFPILWGLIFSFLLSSCSEKKKQDPSIIIQWEGNRAGSIIIPKQLLAGTPNDSIKQLLQVQLPNTNTPILGEYVITDEAVTFQPIIAFTRGLKYEVRLAGKLLAELQTPTDSLNKAPEVISIYPTGDTLPLNVLKMYIAFSKQMQEGQALENIVVIKNNKDTVPSVFLDLQPELWNKERTILTLWLDPGRIKQHLQPNIKMGMPLQQNASYQIVIKQDWRDTEGNSLGNIYRKNFIVGIRDNISPDSERWMIQVPKAGSNEPLKIDLREPLDYNVLKNAVRIVDNKGKVLNGIMESEEEETILQFTPSVAWSSGEYIIEIESRLEDLAGNNLNRLFDKDLTKKTNIIQKDVHKRVFSIQ